MKMTTQMETMVILQRCADIEGVLAEIYEFFAAAYRNTPDITRLFEKTAAEERNHEYQFRLAIKTHAPLIREMTLTTEEADKHLSYAREALHRVRESVPSMEDALRMSINCETIFTRFHLDTAAHFADESCAKLFSAMMATDEGHTTSLKEALAELQKNSAAHT
jgi:rubrerythrin